MNTNIVFESNIYPVKGSIASDKEFLSRVWDYNRLCAINGKQYDNVPLSALQRRIIREQPTCSLNKDDPCWGMVKLDTGYHWVSMCTKTECPHFSDCRARIPYDPEKESDFIPRADMPDEYGYKHFLTEYSPAPVLIGDDVEYSDRMQTTFENTLQESTWCSNDPLCIESTSQGYMGLNYAACHACSLLPETSCEAMNCLIDRASVVGTPDNRDIAYFKDII